MVASPYLRDSQEASNSFVESSEEENGMTEDSGEYEPERILVYTQYLITHRQTDRQRQIAHTHTFFVPLKSKIISDIICLQPEG